MTFDPSTLTPDDIRQLEGRELMTAFAYWVLKDDLTAFAPPISERLNEAVLSCPEVQFGYTLWPDDPESYAVLATHRGTRTPYGPPLKFSQIPYYYGTVIWEIRNGKEWQSDLEAHVSAWRADPPEETDELAVSMFEEDMPLRTYVNARDDVVSFVPIQGTDGEWITYRVYKGNDSHPMFDSIAPGKSLPEAVIRAAIIRAMSGSL